MKYYSSPFGIIQQTNFINKECLIDGSCCVLGDVEILKPVDVALNDGCRRIFDILHWVSV